MATTKSSQKLTGNILRNSKRANSPTKTPEDRVISTKVREVVDTHYEELSVYLDEQILQFLVKQKRVPKALAEQIRSGGFEIVPSGGGNGGPLAGRQGIPHKRTPVGCSCFIGPVNCRQGSVDCE